MQAGEVIICEGYTDVIGFFTAGMPRAVATCGTALTEEHFRLLARFAKRVVLAFDADAAGQSAAARFYEWERRHELEVAVAALPPGSDPAELAETRPRGAEGGGRRSAGPSWLSGSSGRSPPVSCKTGEGRARAAEAAVAMVAEHPNELVRDQYLVTVADRTRLEAERLRPRLEVLVKAFESGSKALAGAGERHDRAHNLGRGTAVGAGRREAGSDAARRRPPADRLEAGASGRTCRARCSGRLRRPCTRRARSGHMAGRVHVVLFADPSQRAALRALWPRASLHEAIEGADDEVADLLRRWRWPSPRPTRTRRSSPSRVRRPRWPSARSRQKPARPRRKGTPAGSPPPEAPSPG